MRHTCLSRWFLAVLVVAPTTPVFACRALPAQLTLHLRSRVEAARDHGRSKIVYTTTHWDATKTAIVVCDMWNTLRCKTAADRVAELAPRMNEVIAEARRRGVLVIHAPSGTVDYYRDTPQRRRCQAAARVATKVPLKWHPLDRAREGPLPIDDADGGWQGHVTPGPPPQTHEHDAIRIERADAVGQGAEVYYLLAQRGIKNVILMGVHTNMCVLGRPFGIRQLVLLGKNVVLMRDMTDSLYNPRRPPHVSHIRGTELVVEHIEKYWCPTITSTDFLDRPAFRFREDKRPHVTFIVSDDHYDADKTLPAFAQMLRARYGCYCTVLHGQGKADIPGTAELEGTDVLVLFIRRLALPEAQLAAIRRYLDAGGPLVALRTACHAFALRMKPAPGLKPPPGRAEWRSFDARVLGGNYHGHAANKLGTDVAIVPTAAGDPLLAGVQSARWHSTGSLYFVSPIDRGATVLMTGSIPGRTEPLTWTRTYHGGRIFFTSLGHPDDFDQPPFRRLLRNAIYWAMGRSVPTGGT